MQSIPIRFEEKAKLPTLGLPADIFRQATVCMESERFVVVKATAPDGSPMFHIIDFAQGGKVQKKPIKADSAMMHPTQNMLCLRKEQNIQILDLVKKGVVANVDFPEPISHWHWVTSNVLGVVGLEYVYHLDISQPVASPTPIFMKSDELKSSQILSYSTDSRTKWCALYGVYSPDRGATINGYIQLYSMERGAAQLLEGYAPHFCDVALLDSSTPMDILCFISKKSADAYPSVSIIEVEARGANPPFKVKQAFQYASEAPNDLPVVSHVSVKYGILFMATKMGYLYMFELFSGYALFQTRVTAEAIFTSCNYSATDGMMAITRKGTVIVISVEDSTIINYIRTNCTHIPNYLNIASKIAGKAPSVGGEELMEEQFNKQVAAKDFMGAAQTALKAPSVRTAKTIAMLKSMAGAPGQPQPLSQYFSVLLEKSKLNSIESMELVKQLLAHNRKDRVAEFLKQDKLECSEELGEMIRRSDATLSSAVFMQSNSHDRVIQSFVESGQLDKIAPFCAKNNMRPDYYSILTRTLADGNRSQAVEFAKMITSRKNTPTPLADPNAVFDIFINNNYLEDAITVMVDALEGNRPEEGHLQTKLFDIAIAFSPKIAEGIFQLNMFTCYDKQKIARLCENAGLLSIALNNYSDLTDIRRIVVNTSKLKKEQIIEFLEKLEPKPCMACLYDILKANPQNLEIVVEAAVKNCKDGRIPAADLLKLFELLNDIRGQYFFLGQIIATSEETELYNKYIKAATQLNELGEVLRVIRDTKFYDPMEIKDYLLQYRLMDPRPLIYLCDIHGYIEELTQYIHKYKIYKYLDAYLRNMNSGSTPKVMGTLLDLDCEESIYKPLLYNIISCPIGPLVEEFEKRNKLKTLINWLEARASEGNITPELHTALAKIYVDIGKEPQTFLMNNPYYDPKSVGKYCENKNPHFAFFAYKKAWGSCDEELVALCYANQFFNLLAQYLVERQSPELWNNVLSAENPHRNNIVEQVLQSALIQTDRPEDIKTTVEAFIRADLSEGLLELLDQIVLHHPDFMNNGNLQTLLIFTAIKSDHTRVMDYVSRLDSYDAPKLAQKALEFGLKEEALEMYIKFGLHEQAMDVMISEQGDLTRAEIYATRIGDPLVWSRLGLAQLDAMKVAEALNSFVRGEDASVFVKAIEAAKSAGTYEELVDYLLMARTKERQPQIDGELIYAYAQCNRLTELEDFLTMSHCADLLEAGEACYSSQLYEAGKILFKHTGNNARLASCLVHLGEYTAALEAAKKANTPRTWMEVNFACVRVRQFKLASIAGLNILIHPDLLGDLIRNYEKYGYWEEAIKLLDTGMTLDQAHNGIFTEQGILLAKYMPERLMSHLKENFSRLHVPRLIRACEEYRMWNEAVYLNANYEQHDRAVMIMMEHSPSAFKHDVFVASLQKAANAELHYRAINFYLLEQPKMLNDMLIAISSKLDLPKTIMVLKRSNYIVLTLPFLKFVQTHNIQAINDAINEILLENDDHIGLRESVLEYDNFEQLKMAARIEKHELVEFRRIAAILYRKNKKFVESLNLTKSDELHKDSIETALESKKPELCEHMLRYFISINERECFASCLYTCYELLKPDIVMELSWRFGMMEFCMPYMVQTMREMTNKLDLVLKKTEDIQKKEEKKANEDPAETMPMEYTGMMMPGFSSNLALMPPPDMMMAGMGNYPMLMPATDMLGMGMGMGMGMGYPPMGYPPPQ